jgi:hypothetical protein
MTKDNDAPLTEAERLRATVAALRAERNRRTTEKLESGELRIKVVGVPQDAPESSANNDPDPDEPITTIVTGVPRGPDWGNWKDEVLLPQYPNRYGAESHPTATAPPKPAPVNPAALEWTKFLATIASPRDERDSGIVAEGRFAVHGKTLYVKDQQGKMFSQDIKPGDNAEHAARRLLKEKHGQHGEFYSPIHYPSLSIH